MRLILAVGSCRCIESAIAGVVVDGIIFCALLKDLISISCCKAQRFHLYLTSDRKKMTI